MCHFCGTRCNRDYDCNTNDTTHFSEFHRPMAFRRSAFLEKDGKRKLKKDYCVS